MSHKTQYENSNLSHLMSQIKIIPYPQASSSVVVMPVPPQNRTFCSAFPNGLDSHSHRIFLNSEAYHSETVPNPLIQVQGNGLINPNLFQKSYHQVPATEVKNLTKSLSISPDQSEIVLRNLANKSERTSLEKFSSSCNPLIYTRPITFPNQNWDLNQNIISKSLENYSDILGTPQFNPNITSNKNIILYSTGTQKEPLSQLSTIDMLKQQSEKKITSGITELLLKYETLDLLTDKILNKERENLKSVIGLGKVKHGSPSQPCHYQNHTLNILPFQKEQLNQFDLNSKGINKQSFQLKLQDCLEFEPKNNIHAFEMNMLHDGFMKTQKHMKSLPAPFEENYHDKVILKPHLNFDEKIAELRPCYMKDYSILKTNIWPKQYAERNQRARSKITNKTLMLKRKNGTTGDLS